MALAYGLTPAGTLIGRRKLGRTVLGLTSTVRRRGVRWVPLVRTGIVKPYYQFRAPLSTATLTPNRRAVYINSLRTIRSNSFNSFSAILAAPFSRRLLAAHNGLQSPTCAMPKTQK